MTSTFLWTFFVALIALVVLAGLVRTVKRLTARHGHDGGARRRYHDR